jgi:hypothetical protein
LVTEAFHEPVFLSHSSLDKPLVRDFFRQLKSTKVRIWFDTFDIVPGEIILERINEGISESQILLLFVSTNSIASHWVKYEWTTFISKKLNQRQSIHLIPIVIDDIEPPESLQNFRYIKLDRTDIRAAVRETAAAIKILAKRLAEEKRGYETLRMYDREKIVDKEITIVERHITIKPLNTSPLELDFHQWQTNSGETTVIRTSVVDNNTQEITPSNLSVIENTHTTFHLRNKFVAEKSQVITAMFEVMCRHYHADIFRIGYSQIDFLIRYPIGQYLFSLEVPLKPEFAGLGVEAKRGQRKVKVREDCALMDKHFKIQLDNLFPMEQLTIVTKDKYSSS